MASHEQYKDVLKVWPMENLINSLSNVPEKPASNALILFCFISAHIGVGYAMGSTSPVMESVSKEFQYTSFLKGFVGASALIGNTFGSFIGGFMTDKLGRKKTLMFTWVLHIIAALCEACAFNGIMFIVARMIIGFTAGSHYAATSTYLSEVIVPASLDKIVSLVELTFFVGITICYGIMYMLRYLHLSETMTWRVLLSLSVIPTTIALLVIFFMLKETNAFIAYKQKKASKKINSEEVVPISSNKESLTSLKNLKSILFVSAFWSSNASPSYCVGAFSIKIIQDMGITLAADLVNTAIGFAGIVGVYLGILTIQNIGTRFTLLFGIGATALMFIALGSLDYFSRTASQLVQILAISCLALYNTTISTTAPLCFIYPGKMFPSEIRGTASGLCAMISRVVTICCMFLTSHTVHHYAPWVLLCGFGIFMLICTCILGLLSPTDKTLNSGYSESVNLNEETNKLAT